MKIFVGATACEIPKEKLARHVQTIPNFSFKEEFTITERVINDCWDDRLEHELDRIIDRIMYKMRDNLREEITKILKREKR